MKKIFNILTAAVLVVMAVSCDRKVDFPHSPFASFSSVSYSIKEDIGTLTIPVLFYNTTGQELQVSVTAVAGTAVEGTDFEIVSPANGILTFSGETDSLAIEVAISKDYIGEFTGAKGFKLQLAAITEGISVGNFNVANVNILDLDHPLAALIGEWVGELEFADGSGTKFPTTLKIDSIEEDKTYTKLTIEGLEPYYANYAVPVEAVYDKSTKIVTIPAGQTGMIVSDAYDFVLIGLDESWSNFVNPRFLLDEENSTLTQLDVFGMLDNNSGSLYTGYEPGAVFTKK